MNPNLDQQPRRPQRWPWIADTPLQRARRVALTYRQHLRTANPLVCDLIDATATDYGETWVTEQPVLIPDDDLITTADAAELVGVDIETIRQWRKRGIKTPDGGRKHLTPDSLNDRGWPLFLAGTIRDFARDTAATRLSRSHT